MEKNEVTIFGTDYNGAISAGKDGWQCEDCGYWNKETIILCVQCERDIEEGA